MATNPLNRFQPMLIAGLLPLLVFTWFTRDVAGQIDFWLLWLVAMTMVGLPLVFTEIALANRSGTTPLIGLQKLTREADVATTWRGFGGLTVLLLLTVISHLLNSSANLLHPLMPNIAMPALLAIMALVAIGFSFAKYLSGWASFALAIIGLMINITQSGWATWQMTQTSLTEWSLAVVLALVCVGAGTGLYWHSRANELLNQAEKSDKAVASRSVLPVWCFQLVGGAVVAMSISKISGLAGVVYALAMLAGASYLLHLVTQQVSLRLHQQGFNFLALVMVAVASLILSMLPTAWLNHILIIISLISAMWLAVFAGWQMKISHLRKSLNFSSEKIYNVWRIAVRIVVPLAVVLALVGWLMGLTK